MIEFDSNSFVRIVNKDDDDDDGGGGDLLNQLEVVHNVNRTDDRRVYSSNGF